MTLCQHRGVHGRARTVYKPKGSKNRTRDLRTDEALNLIKSGLQNNTKAFIYHCYNHYMVPVGFEDVPDKPENTYKAQLEQSQIEPWLIIADNSRKHQTFHSVKWEDIDRDLNLENPLFLDIRNIEKGVQNKETNDYKGRNKRGKNSHCIMEFTSVQSKNK